MKKEQTPAEVARTEAHEWDMFPLSAISINHLPVQALVGRKGLVKGQTYYLVNVHESGLVWVLGGTEAVPMGYFRRARELPPPAEAGAIPSVPKE